MYGLLAQFGGAMRGFVMVLFDANDETLPMYASVYVGTLYL